jgi:ribosomal protein L7/L12
MHRERLELIEAQLAILSERLGVPYEKPVYEEIPEQVRALAAAGKRTEAIKELRSLQGLELAEAVEIVDHL